jgi:hypothetical protein
MTNIKERNRSMHATRRDWTIICCDALQRLLVYVIEGSESAEKSARAGDGNMPPPNRCVTSNVNLMGLLWWLSHNTKTLYVSYIEYTNVSVCNTTIYFIYIK